MLNSSNSESSSASRFFFEGSTTSSTAADILLDRQAAEDRSFLRQVADPQSRALVHRQLGDVVAVEFDGAAIGRNQSRDHVEHGGLACPVRAQQADRLAASDIDADKPRTTWRVPKLFSTLCTARYRPGSRAGAPRPHRWSWLWDAALAFSGAGAGVSARVGGSILGTGVSRAIGGASRTGARQHVAE